MLSPVVRAVACFFLLASPSAALGGNVVVVDASGGGSYTQIQPAIDAVNNGDKILVKTGTYAPFTVDDKDLAVLADYGADMHVTGTVRVRNLSRDRT